VLEKGKHTYEVDKNVPGKQAAQSTGALEKRLRLEIERVTTTKDDLRKMRWRQATRRGQSVEKCDTMMGR